MTTTPATTAKTAKTQPLLELRNVSKAFGAVKALTDVHFTLDAGSIHALVGENGAGKSTLVKIIGGVHTPDSGELLIDGEPVDFRSTAAAKDAGVAGVYPGPTPLPGLPGGGNNFLRHPPHTPHRADHPAPKRRGAPR